MIIEERKQHLEIVAAHLAAAYYSEHIAARAAIAATCSTRSRMGKSVTTPDFQQAMQKAGSKDLSGFFDKRVFLK